MKLSFEPDYRAKLLEIAFEDPCALSSEKDLSPIRQQWLQALSSWHSPYKALIDCSKLTINQSDELDKGLKTLISFFKGFHLRQIAGFGYRKELGHDAFPFDVFTDNQEARDALGIREKKVAEASDFRSTVQFDNHFQQHVIELAFTEPVVIDSEAKLITLKSKLLNNLMLWHSPWSLLIDCSNLLIEEELTQSFQKMETSFKGFHCKRILGYSPPTKGAGYPFKVYRSRHRAAADLESEGNFSGEKANCASRIGESSS